MMIKEGDILISKQDMYFGDEKTLTKNRRYAVFFISNNTNDKKICILDDLGHKHYFGQVGYIEPWNNFFYTEKEFNRIKILDNLLNNQ